MNIFLRIITGFSLLFVVGGIVLYGSSLVFYAVLVFVLIMIALEWQALLPVKFPGGELTPVFVLCGALLVYPFLLDFTATNDRILFLLAVAWPGLLCIQVFVYAIGEKKPFLANILHPSSFFILSSLYAICGIKLHILSEHLAFLCFFILCAVDTGGYMFGKMFGGPRLCPRISPKKTVSGFIGGSFLGFMAYLVVLFFFSEQLPDAIGWSPLTAACIIIYTTFTQFGDLYQSVLKREAGVKDSGHVLPGHGGIFDRADNFLFGIPLFYGVCYLLI